MGFHVCPVPATGFIHGDRQPRGATTSSGDLEVRFAGGRKWRFPDALVYYILDCGYRPPDAFVEDVLSGPAADVHRWQTKGGGHRAETDKVNTDGGCIGYLDQADVDEAALNPWTPPEGFMAGLTAIFDRTRHTPPGLLPASPFSAAGGPHLAAMPRPPGWRPG